VPGEARGRRRDIALSLTLAAMLGVLWIVFA
jgi:hypothetical protein